MPFHTVLLLLVLVFVFVFYLFVLFPTSVPHAGSNFLSVYLPVKYFNFNCCPCFDPPPVTT